MCALIERSLGSPESFPVVSARAAFMDVAREEDVRVPLTEVIRTREELRTWVERTGLPTVLKANGTSGGDGVRIAHTLADAERFFEQLQAPPLFARAVKRAIVDRDKTLLGPSMLRRRPVVNAQAFVAGREATSAIGLLERNCPCESPFRSGQQGKFHRARHRGAPHRERRNVGCGRGDGSPAQSFRVSTGSISCWKQKPATPTSSR